MSKSFFFAALSKDLSAVSKDPDAKRLGAFSLFSPSLNRQGEALSFTISIISTSWWLWIQFLESSLTALLLKSSEGACWPLLIHSKNVCITKLFKRNFTQHREHVFQAWGSPTEQEDEHYSSATIIFFNTWRTTVCPYIPNLTIIWGQKQGWLNLDWHFCSHCWFFSHLMILSDLPTWSLTWTSLC